MATFNNQITMISLLEQIVSGGSLPVGAATSALQVAGNSTLSTISTTQTDGSQKSICRGGAKGSTTAADITSTNQSVDRNAIDVQIRTSAGVAVDSFGGGTQYADGAVRGTATGTLMMVDDGVNIQSASGTSAGVLKVDLSDTTANSTAINVNGPTLTKGTQDSTGFSVQNLIDAGRTNLVFYATAAAAGATNVQTAITLTKSSNTGATSTGVSFVITNGKRFRIENITFATRGNNTATAQQTTFNFRLNTAGAVITTSTPIIMSMRSATPATANAWDRVIMPIPDGYEILGDGTLQFGITAAATYTTNAPTWDVTIVGFEY